MALPREEIEGGLTPGDDFPIFETDFGTAGMMICWDVHFPEPHYQLGRYYFEAKVYQKALQAFHKALEVDEAHYKAHYYAALCLKGSGQYEASEKAFRTAIRIVEQKKIRYG